MPIILHDSLSSLRQSSPASGQQKRWKRNMLCFFYFQSFLLFPCIYVWLSGDWNKFCIKTETNRFFVLCYDAISNPFFIIQIILLINLLKSTGYLMHREV